MQENVLRFSVLLWKKLKTGNAVAVFSQPQATKLQQSFLRFARLNTRATAKDRS
jgi:hypothetical protein